MKIIKTGRQGKKSLRGFELFFFSVLSGNAGVWTCDWELSCITPGSRVLECQTFDKAQVSMKREQPSREKPTILQWTLNFLSPTLLTFVLLLTYYFSPPPRYKFSQSGKWWEKIWECCKSSCPHATFFCQCWKDCPRLHKKGFHKVWTQFWGQSLFSGNNILY